MLRNTGVALRGCKILFALLIESLDIVVENRPVRIRAKMEGLMKF